MDKGKLPRRIRDLSRKPKITLSLQPAGVALTWLSLGLVAAGVFTSGQTLLVGLIGLALLPVCKWLARKQLAGLSFTRQLPRRVFSGERFEIEATIHNANTRIESSELLVFDPMADAAARSTPLTLLGCRSSRKLVWMGRLFRRGWEGQNQITVTSCWPLGIFEARLDTHFQSSDEKENGLLVIPRPHTPVFLAQARGLMEKESPFISAMPPDSPSEFRYLREFQPGDAIRSIHWPSSTRSGMLYVKENDPPTPTPNRYGLLIHSFAAPGEVIRNDRFELTLRIATGLVIAFQKQNCAVLFSTSFADDGMIKTPAKTGFTTILNQLARAPVRFSNDLDSPLLSLNALASCDQVFVLGSAPRSSWEKTILEVLPSCICIDTESLSNNLAERRRPLIRKATTT